ncbi:sodium:solute symporter family protein [Candidatus Latescibacterota bacterium]
MTLSDYIVLIVYVAGVFAVGGLFGGKIKTSRDMFAAGGTSPWWVSGLSGFMTMFSAGTFVVWGGIAYKHGAVAISISLCYGVSALFVGWFIAGQWNKTGVTTAAEFIELRFGKAALQFYTWSGMTYKLVSVGVALYSVAVLISALVTLPDGAPFRDPSTGNLALNWAILVFGGIVVVYTVVGGLWAVLMTDVLQFIVLTLAVTIVVPMILGHADVGGISGFLAQAPEGFLSPTSGDFTWIFMVAWMAIHVFIIGGEWAFVQRFLCVPTEKDARKSSWLFGIMYLVSPVLWMLPPMVYRLINPSADPKEAYILACREVLPPGVVGLMLAAMFSATASMVDSQLNVFSGVLTRDFYRNMFRPESSEESLVGVGRIITTVLGLVLIGLALAVPYLGGAENVILSITSLIVVPLLAPTVWGLLSKRIGAKSVWLTAGICFCTGALVNFGFSSGGFLENVSTLETLTAWIQSHHRLMQQLVGVLLPILILAFLEWRSSDTDSGWIRVEGCITTRSSSGAPSSFPARVVSWSLLILGVLLTVLAIVHDQSSGVLFAYSALMIVSGIAMGMYIRRKI